MTVVLLFCFVGLSLAFEPIAAAQLSGTDWAPDFLLAAVVLLIVRRPGVWAVVAAALAGLARDALSAPRLGPQMATFAALATVASLQTGRTTRTPPASLLPLSLAAAFIAEQITWWTCSPLAFAGVPKADELMQLAKTASATALLVTALALSVPAGAVVWRLLVQAFLRRSFARSQDWSA